MEQKSSSEGSRSTTDSIGRRGPESSDDRELLVRDP
jgi:hypothetical protein